MIFGKKRKPENVYVVPERSASEQALLERVIEWTNDDTLTWSGYDFPVASLQSSPETFRLSGCTLYVESEGVSIVIERVCPDLTDAVDRARDKRRAELIQRLVAQ